MSQLAADLDRMLEQAPGSWGVALIDRGGALRYGWREHEILPSASLIKFPLAWQCLELAADGVLDLELAYPLRPDDICDQDGSLAALAAGAAVPWRELLRVMISESENNATNIVLHLVGMQAANEWLAARGWAATRWRRRMLDFAARQEGRDNTASAYELAAMFHSFGAALGGAGSALEPLRQWLLAAGRDQKLDAGLPPGTPLAHKTGDLPGGVEHDAGLVYRPGGGWYALAVMADQAPVAMRARRLIGEISRRCWDEPGG
ncbi:MAG TPA: serine hydrolase [Herpetosiphonaceae bacterium]